MIDYLHHIGEESAAFNRAVAAIDRPGDGGAALDAAPVRSCGEWSAADLTWHLAEVQYFWASIVEGNLSAPDKVVRTERPAAGELVAFHQAQGQRLLSALDGRDPEDSCWTWHPAGNTVGWVLRRQAHEALIHRIDADLAAVEAGVADVGAIDEALATDGVDEMLDVMLNAVETDDLAFTPDGTSVRIVAPSRSWDLQLGQATGALDDGRQIDLAAISLGPLSSEPTVEIRADGSVLDLWLWRRGPLPEGATVGDATVAERLHELAKID